MITFEKSIYTMMAYQTIGVLVFCFILLCGCRQDMPTHEEPDTNTPRTASRTLSTTEGFQQVWQTDSVFQIPESVVYDPLRRKLYVSNIAGAPSQKDGNGFLSVVDLNGKVEQLHWITGLNAPKGLYIHDDLLYAADLDQLVIISILEGSIITEIAIPDAKFLNAITYLPDSGIILITDTELNRIYWLDADGQTGVWLENEALAGPNGIFYHNKALLLASFEGQQLLHVDPVGLGIHPIAHEIGAGDGIVVTTAGDTIVSDWGGKISLIKNGQAAMLTDLGTINENAADLEWVASSNIVVVPTFLGNRLRAFRLSTVKK